MGYVKKTQTTLLGISVVPLGISVVPFFPSYLGFSLFKLIIRKKGTLISKGVTAELTLNPIVSVTSARGSQDAD